MPYHVPKPIFVYGINGGTRVFIPEGPRDGKAPTRWVMADACVALVKCPECGAEPLQWCLFSTGKRGISTHFRRRMACGKIRPDHRVRTATTKQPFPEEEDCPNAEEHW